METKTLKLNKEFKRAYYRGKSAVRPSVVVYVYKNRSRKNRLGLTCGKAVGSAVRRNRAKRLMRESFRRLENRLKPGFDFVLVARSRTPDKSFFEVDADLQAALKKLEMFSE